MPRPFGESPFPDRKDVGRPTRRRTLAAALRARSRRRRRQRQAARRREFRWLGGASHQKKVTARLVEPPPSASATMRTSMEALFVEVSGESSASDRRSGGYGAATRTARPW